MAVVTGTVANIHTLEGTAWSGHAIAEVCFNVSGTYAQADNGILSGVPTLIQNSRRNGKTVTMRGVMPGRPAIRDDTGAELPLKTVAISTNDVTYEITTNWSSEFTDATAVPAHTTRPFSIMVLFTEA